ncbi:MAG: hypothetical protein WD048_07205 [Chitinophagales bacterium]
MKTKVILISFSVLVKLAMLFAFAYQTNPNLLHDFKLYNEYAGDAPDYIEPVENLLTHGSYYFGENNYAGRMPGMTVLYLPLRLLFEKHIALNLLLIIQTILSGVSVFFLAKLVYKRTSNIRLFYSTLFIYLFCTYVSRHDAALMTESLAASSLIFSLYYFNKAISLDFDKKHLFFSGAFFSWCVFLRPYMLPVFGLFWLVLLYHHYKVSFKKVILLSFIFTSTFIVADIAWIIRNYKFEHKIVPLQSTLYKGYDFTGWYKSKGYFISSFGGDGLSWSPNSHAAWFSSDEYLKKYGFERPGIEIFPETLFYEDLTKDTLRKVQSYIIELSKDADLKHLDKKQRDFYESEVVRILDEFRNRYIENYPFQYYVVSPLKYLVEFTVLQSYTYYLPYTFNEASIFGKIFKIFTYSYNFLIVHVGFLSLIWLFYKRKIDSLNFIIYFTILFILIFFPILRRGSEYRMMVLAFPLFIYVINYFISTLRYKSINP